MKTKIKMKIKMKNKTYLVSWFNNAWHNEIFYGKNVKDVLFQCRDINIIPKKIEQIKEQ